MQPTMRKTLIESRVGQGIYRSKLAEIEKRCRVIGIKEATFLIASHIRPWKVSTDIERLVGNNGFFLAALKSKGIKSRCIYTAAVAAFSFRINCKGGI